LAVHRVEFGAGAVRRLSRTERSGVALPGRGTPADGARLSSSVTVLHYNQETAMTMLGPKRRAGTLTGRLTWHTKRPVRRPLSATSNLWWHLRANSIDTLSPIVNVVRSSCDRVTDLS